MALTPIEWTPILPSVPAAAVEASRGWCFRADNGFVVAHRVILLARPIALSRHDTFPLPAVPVVDDDAALGTWAASNPTMTHWIGGAVLLADGTNGRLFGPWGHEVRAGSTERVILHLVYRAA